MQPTPQPTPADAGDLDAVRITVSRGRVTVDAPRSGRALDAMRADLVALRPDLVRALAPELPPVDVWPASWREAFEERACIAHEGGAADPLAVADADLRAAVWRGDLEALDLEALDGYGVADAWQLVERLRRALAPGREVEGGAGFEGGNVEG